MADAPPDNIMFGDEVVPLPDAGVVPRVGRRKVVVKKKRRVRAVVPAAPPPPPPRRVSGEWRWKYTNAGSIAQIKEGLVYGNIGSLHTMGASRWKIRMTGIPPIGWEAMFTRYDIAPIMRGANPTGNYLITPRAVPKPVSEISILKKFVVERKIGSIQNMKGTSTKWLLKLSANPPAGWEDTFGGFNLVKTNKNYTITRNAKVPMLLPGKALQRVRDIKEFSKLLTGDPEKDRLIAVQKFAEDKEKLSREDYTTLSLLRPTHEQVTLWMGMNIEDTPKLVTFNAEPTDSTYVYVSVQLYSHNMLEERVQLWDRVYFKATLDYATAVAANRSVADGHFDEPADYNAMMRLFRGRWCSTGAPTRRQADFMSVMSILLNQEPSHRMLYYLTIQSDSDLHWRYDYYVAEQTDNWIKRPLGTDGITPASKFIKVRFTNGAFVLPMISTDDSCVYDWVVANMMGKKRLRTIDNKFLKLDKDLFYKYIYGADWPACGNKVSVETLTTYVLIPNQWHVCVIDLDGYVRERIEPIAFNHNTHTLRYLIVDEEHAHIPDMTTAEKMSVSKRPEHDMYVSKSAYEYRDDRKPSAQHLCRDTTDLVRILGEPPTAPVILIHTVDLNAMWYWFLVHGIRPQIDQTRGHRGTLNFHIWLEYGTSMHMYRFNNTLGDSLNEIRFTEPIQYTRVYDLQQQLDKVVFNSATKSAYHSSVVDLMKFAHSPAAGHFWPDGVILDPPPRGDDGKLIRPPYDIAIDGNVMYTSMLMNLEFYPRTNSFDCVVPYTGTRPDTLYLIKHDPKVYPRKYLILSKHEVDLVDGKILHLLQQVNPKIIVHGQLDFSEKIPMTDIKNAIRAIWNDDIITYAQRKDIVNIMLGRAFKRKNTVTRGSVYTDREYAVSDGWEGVFPLMLTDKPITDIVELSKYRDKALSFACETKTVDLDNGYVWLTQAVWNASKLTTYMWACNAERYGFSLAGVKNDCIYLKQGYLEDNMYGLCEYLQTFTFVTVDTDEPAEYRHARDVDRYITNNHTDAGTTDAGTTDAYPEKPELQVSPYPFGSVKCYINRIVPTSSGITVRDKPIYNTPYVYRFLSKVCKITGQPNNACNQFKISYLPSWIDPNDPTADEQLSIRNSMPILYRGSSVVHIPYESEYLTNPNYTIRANEIIGQLLEKGSVAIVSKLAGSGKTQMAITYLDSLNVPYLVMSPYNRQRWAHMGSPLKPNVTSITVHVGLGITIDVISKRTPVYTKFTHVLVDETAMLDLRILSKIQHCMEAHPKIKWLFTYDPNQLAPIMDDTPPSVYKQALERLCPSMIELNVMKRVDESIRLQTECMQMSLNKIIDDELPFDITEWCKDYPMITTIPMVYSAAVFNLRYHVNTGKDINRVLASGFPTDRYCVKKTVRYNGNQLTVGTVYRYDGTLIHDEKLEESMAITPDALARLFEPDYCVGIFLAQGTSTTLPVYIYDSTSPRVKNNPRFWKVALTRSRVGLYSIVLNPRAPDHILVEKIDRCMYIDKAAGIYTGIGYVTMADIRLPCVHPHNTAHVERRDCKKEHTKANCKMICRACP